MQELSASDEFEDVDDLGPQLHQKSPPPLEGVAVGADSYIAAEERGAPQALMAAKRQSGCANSQPRSAR